MPVTYSAVATAPQRIRLIFTEPMSYISEISDPASYSVTGVDGTAMTISYVIVEQAFTPVSVMLLLSSAMATTKFYTVLVLSPAIVSAGFAPETPTPLGNVFQWVKPATQFSVPISDFSTEPVCTKAYDTYTFPQPVDPSPLFFYTPGATASTIGGSVLWGGFARLSEVRFDLSFTGPEMVELMPTAVDGPADATLTEPFDIDYVAYLNNPAWAFFDPLASTRTFICADNLAPIPAGPTVNISLQP